MKARQLQSVLAIMLLGAVSTASAAVLDLSSIPNGPGLDTGDFGLVPTTFVAPGSFTGDWYFSLNSPSGLEGDVVGINLPGLTHIKDLALTLIDLTTDTTYVSDARNFDLASLPKGNYELEVTGDATGRHGGIYAGAIAVLPLPAAAWLLLSGLAGVAVLARRRGGQSPR